VKYCSCERYREAPTRKYVQPATPDKLEEAILDNYFGAAPPGTVVRLSGGMTAEEASRNLAFLAGVGTEWEKPYDPNYLGTQSASGFTTPDETADHWRRVNREPDPSLPRPKVQLEVSMNAIRPGEDL
jgi:hypothetical protein